MCLLDSCSNCSKVIQIYVIQLIDHTGAAMTGGEMSASAVTSTATGKASATPTVSGSATSVAGAAPVGEATAAAGAAAGAEAAVEERAGTESTEEAEVRNFPHHSPPSQPVTTAQGSRPRSAEVPKAPVSTVEPCISGAGALLEGSWTCLHLLRGDQAEFWMHPFVLFLCGLLVWIFGSC